ncbi:MAG: hypothetical protein IT318_12050 [Anaerolineales bacterium]|nr:hypothetical protein [Anaerolineales bacterium]
MLSCSCDAAADPPSHLCAYTPGCTQPPTQVFAHWGVTTAITGRATDAQTGQPYALE